MKKNLIICPVGKGSLHTNWISKKLNADVIFIHYDNDIAPISRNGLSVMNTYMKGAKFNLIKELWDKGKIKKDYKYYCCLDDDILISTDQLNRFFEIAKEEKLCIFHPCLQPLNHNAQEMYKQPGRKIHFINWIELQCIGFTNEYFKKAVKYFDENKSGWGLPQIWYNEFKIRDLYAIIDEIEVIHTRPMGKGENTIYNTIEDEGKIEGAKAEYFQIMMKHGIKQWALEETKYPVLNRPLCSANIITCDRDVHLLAELLETLPEWMEIVIFHTKGEQAANEYELKEESKNFKLFEFRYVGKYLQYDKVRNIAKKESNGMFIWWIDSDERAMIHQHTKLHQELLQKSVDNRFGGIAIDIISSQTLNQTVCEKQVRIFKNIPEIVYEGAVYEAEHWSIEENRFEIFLSDFRVEHLGYRGDVNDMEDKLKTRIETALKFPEILFKRPSTFELFIRDCKNYDKFKNIRIEREKQESCKTEK